MKNDISKMINDELQGYIDSVENSVEKIVEKISEEALEAVKSKSPASNKQRAKKYKNGWIIKEEFKKSGTRYIIKNDDEPHLTHLLEYGHVKANKYGSHGFVSGRPHVEPVAKEFSKKFYEEVKKTL